MTRPGYDVIVIGVGGMGSATCFELARRGARVLGLEQFEPGHDRGSSHGQTRVIRTAYYEHPCYVPLVRRSFEGWRELEQRTGRTLLTDCGCLNIGRAGSSVLEGVRQSAGQHDLKVEELSGAAIRRRFPPLHFSDEYCGVLEHEAGFLFVEECVKAHAYAARLSGAEIQNHVTVRAWGPRVTACVSSPIATCFTPTGWSSRRGPGPANYCGPGSGSHADASDNALVRHARRLALSPRGVSDLSRGGARGVLLRPAGDRRRGAQGRAPLRGAGASRALAISREVVPADEQPVREFLNRYVPDVNGPRNRGQVCTTL